MAGHNNLFKHQSLTKCAQTRTGRASRRVALNRTRSKRSVKCKVQWQYKRWSSSSSIVIIISFIEASAQPVISRQSQISTWNIRYSHAIPWRCRMAATKHTLARITWLKAHWQWHMAHIPHTALPPHAVKLPAHSAENIRFLSSPNKWNTTGEPHYHKLNSCGVWRLRRQRVLHATKKW